MMSERTHSPILDRAGTREEWNLMRAQYHELVISIAPEALYRPTTDTRWSIAEILDHMIQSIEMMPRCIESIRRGKDFMNLPIVIIGATNYLLVKTRARNVTTQALLDRYDRAFTAATKAWDSVGDDEWDRGAKLFGEGYKTLADYYRHAPSHFLEHSAQIQRAL